MKTSAVRKEQSLATLSLMAALADGKVSDGERAIVNEQLGKLTDEERRQVYSRVMNRRTDVADELSALSEEQQRTEALRLARQICEADHHVTDREKQFLTQLEKAIGASDKRIGTTHTIPAWTLDFSARAAAMRMLDQPMTPIWMSTLKIQMARALRNHPLRIKKEITGRREVLALSRFLLMPDRSLLAELSERGVEIVEKSPQFAFASTAALGFLLEKFYWQGESLTPLKARAAYLVRFEEALGQYERHLDLIETWLREGEPLALVGSQLSSPT